MDDYGLTLEEPDAAGCFRAAAPTGVQREVENAGAALAEAVTLPRQGELPAVGCDLDVPRPK